ncbi:MAG TPA: hypothetical protein VFF29_02985, partial [Bacteroidota bacterium]|nr:hypothetical protein [Bacteroidota bacterium]
MNCMIPIHHKKWNVISSIPRLSLVFFLTLILCGAHSAHSQGTWIKKSSGNGLGNPFCINPLNDSIIYAATGNNILRISRDKGNTWQILSVLTGGHEIKSVAVSARDTNLILVAQESGPPDRIVKSTNHGSTWVQTFANNFYYWGVPLAYLARSDNDTVYTMGSDIIWRSTNFGNTWDSVRASPFESFNQGWEYAVVRPDSTNILLVADNATGIWKSYDYGVNWKRVHATTGEVPAIAYTPGNPVVMY